jgi:hypothetical protein
MNLYPSQWRINQFPTTIAAPLLRWIDLMQGQLHDDPAPPNPVNKNPGERWCGAQSGSPVWHMRARFRHRPSTLRAVWDHTVASTSPCTCRLGRPQLPCLPTEPSSFLHGGWFELRLDRRSPKPPTTVAWSDKRNGSVRIGLLFVGYLPGEGILVHQNIFGWDCVTEPTSVSNKETN